jgi:ABC-type transport system involved in cytochrome c biogenesis permease subunit
MELTPDVLFVNAFVVSSLASVAVLLLGNDKLTKKKILLTALVFGIAGTSTAMMIYQACDGEHYPWRAMGAAGLIGVRVDRVIKKVLEKFGLGDLDV